MALTITPVSNDVWGSTEVRVVTAQPASADYVTGGYAITPGQGVSLRTIATVEVIGGQAGYVLVWNPATAKLQVWVTGTAAGDALNEAAAGTDLSALTLQLRLTGN